MRPRRVLALVVVLLSLGMPLAAQTSGVREVTASDRSVIPLNTKLRYTTMVVLPQDEEIPGRRAGRPPPTRRRTAPRRT